LITVSESSGHNNVDGVDEIQKLWPSSWPFFNIALHSDMRAEPTSEKDKIHQEGRQVRAFLFCDVVGYSKLDEAEHPTFLHSFLRRIATEIPRPEFVNTGGDSLFMSTKDALSLAQYALELQQLIDTTNWLEAGLPPDLAMRCALHAGPAYEIEDPFTGRMNLYGSHVNRAARIEPITVPGQIYASEQFVAFIISDLLAAGFSDPESFPMGFTYLGVLDLAKSFGTQSTYRLYKREC
jgi:class 3 adenylate cyclase